MPNGIAIGVVHVEVGSYEARNDEQGRGDGGLERESSAVVADFAKSPEQHQRKPDVERREQANPERILGVPHVIRPTDEIAAGGELPTNVRNPKNTCGDRAYSLTREKQRIRKPNADERKDDGDVAQVQQIGPAPHAEIRGKPDEHPREAEPAQYWKWVR